MPLRALLIAAMLGASAACRAPAKEGSAPKQSDPPAEPEIRTYRQVGGQSLRAHVFPPAGNDAGVPAILLFHGGGWSAGSPEWVLGSARRFAALGLVAAAIEYRLASDSVTPIDALADVCAALQWARGPESALGADPARVAAYGVSAGGHLAAAAATIGCGNTEGSRRNGGPDALVLLSPALDVSRDGHFERLLRGRAPVAAYSPAEHLRDRMPATVIVHGDRDSLTPLSGARRFCDGVIAAGAPCELNIYSGVGHLLTRNLANQESDFDPDPAMREEGFMKQLRFIENLWLR